jgi:GNAT superfamily N-acetyltransferase
MTAGTHSVHVTAPDPALHGEQLWALMDRVFGEGTGADCRDGRIAHSHYDWQTSRIGLVDDRVVAHFGVYDLAMRVGRATVRTAGVNLVGTDPDFRRRGYMAAVTKASLAAMQENGYALSLVCNGEPNLYGRHGYVYAWPESSWTVKTSDLPPEDASAVALKALDISEFTPGEHPELWELYNRWHEGVTGTAVRPTFRRLKTPNSPGTGVRAASRADGRLIAYVVADLTEDKKTLWLDDAAGDPDVIVALLSRWARREGCEEVKVSRQPFRVPLVRQLRTLTAREENRYAADGRWMVRVIDPVRLIEALEPELTPRLQRSLFAGWNGRITIKRRSDKAILHVQHGRVHAHSGAAPVLGQLAIGAVPPEELLAGHGGHGGHGGHAGHAGYTVTSDPAGAEELILNLFPYKQPMMSNGDI